MTLGNPRRGMMLTIRRAGTIVTFGLVFSIGISSLLGCGSGGGDTGSSTPTDAMPQCTAPPNVGADLTTALAKYPNLSDWCLFDVVKTAGKAKLVAKRGVIAYDLNTPLFSDYARKYRAVWMPPGTSAKYVADDVFDFPVGTILIKTFGFAADLRKPDDNVTLIETRLIVRTADKWVPLPYAWNDEQTEATLQVGGNVKALSFIGEAGETVASNYLLPSSAQCGTCHADEASTFQLLGPKAKNLNRDFVYDGVTENQLAHWSKVLALTGAPSPSAAPKMAKFDDPASGTVEERARAYLEVNCAHCHDEHRTARTTGLFLPIAESDAAKWGRCKPPVAAGPGTGGFSYDIVPGKPDQSVLFFRIQSTTPGLMMPALGRSVVHKEGVELVRAWISGLSGDCSGK